MPMHTLSLKKRFIAREVTMSQKKAAPTLNIKRLLSAILCLVLAVVPILSMIRYDFSLPKLLFALLCLYVSFSFFRTAKE